MKSYGDQNSIKGLPTISYEAYKKLTLPKEGQHILAHYDSENIVVYQAYNETIAKAAVRNQAFTAESGYSFKRMSWIKPNFLWMMYRSSWGSAKNQTHIGDYYKSR